MLEKHSLLIQQLILIKNYFLKDFNNKNLNTNNIILL